MISEDGSGVLNPTSTTSRIDVCLSSLHPTTTITTLPLAAIAAIFIRE